MKYDAEIRLYYLNDEERDEVYLTVEGNKIKTVIDHAMHDVYKIMEDIDKFNAARKIKINVFEHDKKNK